MLEKEIKFFNENIEEWLKTQSGKFVLVKSDELIGFFNTYEEAISEGARRFGLESFLVRHIIPVQQEVSNIAMTIGVLNANPTQPIQG